MSTFVSSMELFKECTEGSRDSSLKSDIWSLKRREERFWHVLLMLCLNNSRRDLAEMNFLCVCWLSHSAS